MSTDERQQIARAALAEFTRPGDVGELVAQTDDGEGVSTLAFSTAMPGYPGWQWTVSLAEVEGSAPTVLEAELLPADGSLVAPDWVPWSERLEDYRAAQAAIAEAGELDGDLDDDDLDDDDDEEDDLDDEDEDDEDDDDSEDDDEFAIIDDADDDSAAPLAEPVGVDEGQ